MYIQIYNLKGCFECKRKKMCGKTADLWRIVCLLRWVFVDFGKFMGKNRPYPTVSVPAITLTCPITTTLLIQDRLRSNRIHVERRRILNLCAWLSLSYSGRRQHAICAQNSSPAEGYFQTVTSDISCSVIKKNHDQHFLSQLIILKSVLNHHVISVLLGWIIVIFLIFLHTIPLLVPTPVWWLFFDISLTLIYILHNMLPRLEYSIPNAV